MTKNLGNTDRIARTLVAIILAGLYATGVVIGQWGITIMVIATVLLLTAAAGVCPLYKIFGLNTCRLL